MKIEVIKKEDGYIKLNIKETDPHTLFNLLHEELLNDPKVSLAGYWKNESFYDSIIFQVRMVDEKLDPLEAIYRALDRIKEKALEFIEAAKQIES